MTTHDSDRLRLRAGVPVLGALARGLFLVSFLLGALVSLAALVGAVRVLRGDHDASPLALVCVFLGGLTMAIPGGVVAFTSADVVLDRRRRELVHTWYGLGLPLRRRVVPYGHADALLLERSTRDSSLYTGSLRGLEPRLELFREAGPVAGRARAREVASFLGLPVFDQSGGAPVVIPADARSDHFAARHADAQPPRPRRLLGIRFVETPAGAELTFPAKGFGPIEALIVGLFALLSAPALIALVAALVRPRRAGELLANACCYSILMGIFALLRVVPVLRYALSGAVVEVAGGDLRVRHTGLSRRVLHVPGAQIHGVVHVSRAEMAATPQQRLRPGEVTLRLADEDLHLGRGQPDDDLAWAAEMLTFQLVRTAPGEALALSAHLRDPTRAP